MFCPKCGSSQADDLRFCKQCGTNLVAVRTAVSVPDSVEKFDWSKTWVAEMFMTQNEKERYKGQTPEAKRRGEIKAGVITSSVGLGAMIFLYVLMQGIILSGQIKPGEEEILSRIWLSGIIPFFIGIALIINGLIVSKMFTRSEIMKRDDPARTLGSASEPEFLPPADTRELFPADFSVTENTTKHLKVPRKN
jgi:hypothetical protein